jgi:peptide/nickel transport system substrate-binding protein
MLLLLPILFLTACELVAPPPSTASPLPTPTLPPLALAVDVRADAIIVSIPIDPPSFNAYLNDTGYEALAGELVYGALAEIGPDGSYYPELAAELPTLTNGGLSEDGLTVTWKLRPGVVWSDDQPFTSADVAYTWQSFKDSGIWAPGIDLIDTVETPDPQTAVIRYRQFYPNYLIQFGGNGTGIFPAHHCGPTNQMLFWDCNLEPISTGPFVLDQWIPGVRLTFAPNPRFYIPERPLVPQLVFEIQPDPDFRRRNLERGNTHLDLWPEDPALTLLENNENVSVLVTNPARYVLRLVPNLSLSGSADPDQPNPALANVQVRQAVRYAVDVNRLNEEAFLGRATPVDTELFQLGCQIPHYDFNPGLSIALIDQAGWRLTNPDDPIRYCQGCGTAKDGDPLILKSYIYEEFGDELTKAHQLLEEMLLEVGIKLERQVIEGGQLWNTWENNGLEIHGNFDLDLWDDGYYGVDPTLYMADYFDPRSIPTRDNPIAGLNYSRYRNPTLIGIFDALRTPLPTNRRRTLLCELATILYQDLPQMPLLALPDRYAINLNLQGVAPHIYDTITWNATEWRLLTPPEEQ